MRKEFICESCKHVGEVDGYDKRGNFWIETILWTIYMLPGIIYSIWRRTAKKRCRNCHGRQLVAVDSKKGKKLMERILLEKLMMESIKK